MVHILIIEADPWLREGLSEVLHLEGFNTVEVQRGKDALAELVQWCPPLILCNGMLPDMSGHELIQHIRLNPSTMQTPIIFLTSFTAPDFIRHALHLGANDYLTKPFDLEDLFQLIRKHLSA